MLPDGLVHHVCQCLSVYPDGESVKPVDVVVAGLNTILPLMTNEILRSPLLQPQQNSCTFSILSSSYYILFYLALYIYPPSYTSGFLPLHKQALLLHLLLYNSLLSVFFPHYELCYIYIRISSIFAFPLSYHPPHTHSSPLSSHLYVASSTF